MAFPQNYVTVSRRPPDVEDYIEMLRRYRSWVIGPTFAGLVIAVVVACIWNDTYISTAVMRITPQSVPTNLVPSQVSGQMAQRLEMMTVQILSRTELMNLIQSPALDLYKKERANTPLEDVAERMRTKDIKIRMYDAPGVNQKNGAAAFQISFSYPDRWKAQQLVRDLTGKFQEQSYRMQKTAADATGSFLETEMARVKKRQDDKDAELAAFEKENQGKLPEAFQANMMQIQNMENQIAGIEDSISRDQQVKLTLETNLQNLRQQERQAASGVERTVVTQNATVRNSRIEQLDKGIMELNQRYIAALNLYKEDYPEVLTLKKQIENLEGQRKQLEKEDSSTPGQASETARAVTDPVALAHVAEIQAAERSTTTQIANVQLDMEARLRRRAQVEKDLRDVQAKVAASPQIVARYNQLQQEVKLAKDDYEQTSKKQDLTETAKNLEEHKAGEQLELLEGANAPETPDNPNRPLIIIAGTFAGLLLGFGLAGAKEIKNTSLKNLKDVRAYTNLPVLSSIPLLENALLVRRKRRIAWLAWSSAVIIGGIVMAGAAYYRFSNISTGPS